MSALPGGAADKLGNRYEDWWTLCRLADMLRGRASRMRLEPPGDDGTGVEFYLEEANVRWYEQVKDASSQGSWTLRRLIREGVLASLGVHLKQGHNVRLVVSTAAADLANLSQRARDTDTPEEFEKILNETLKPWFKKVAEEWMVSPASTWEYLRRVYVEQHSPEQLRRVVHQYFEMLVQGDPARVVGQLRGWLDEMLHQTITAPMVWSFLEAQGLARRLLAGDPTTMDALAGTVARHYQRVQANRPVLATTAHPQLADLVELVSAPEGPQVLVIHGKAGSGKSTLAADALHRLRTAGWYAAAVSMDSVQPSLQTAAALGRIFDLSSSPVVLLDGVANGSPGVLLVDQLDAVSTYSGRMQDSYTAVAELLEQTSTLPNIKVMLVVRTVDLTSDSRMRSLRSDAGRAATFEVRDLTAEDVRRVLGQLGIDATTLTPATLQLLCVPLHLAVFAGLSASSWTAPYRTLPDLYEQFTTERRRRIEDQVGHLDWIGITSVLVEFMNDHERLRAPAAILDSAATREVDALISHGVLIEDDDNVMFFHETYFDFLFARAFVAAGRDLHEFLVGSGQFLFRRAQTRQVLEYLAAKDRPTFRALAVTLLTSESIRVHLHHVVIAVLGQLDAEAEDWREIEPLALSHHKYGQQLMNLLCLPHWFDTADAMGRWERLLADDATVDLAADQLVAAARHRPARVAALVRPYIGVSDRWSQRLRALITWSLKPELVDLTVELIERGDLDDARGPIAVNADFWTILYSLESDDPRGAARLTGAYLQRTLVRANAAHSGDPFACGILNRYSSAGGASTITTIAAGAPKTFLAEVLPFVAQVADATAPPAESGELRHSPHWGHYHVGERHDIQDALYGGLEDALVTQAREQPQNVQDLTQPLRDSDLHDLRFLTCRALTAARIGDEAVAWLLADARNLRLGWVDSPRWASRELVEAATASCDAQHLDALTQRLLTHYSAWEKTTQGRRTRGWSQYELLSGIHLSRRSDSVRRRIDEWERKFSGQTPIGPRAVEFEAVEPPVPAAAAPLLTDEDWIRAIEKYVGDTMDWRGHGLVGGVGELAGILGSRADAEPERFARLALTFGTAIPYIHLNTVIATVATKISIPLLAQLSRHARDVAGQASGLAICRAVHAVSADADDALVSLVQECATDNDPDRNADRATVRRRPGGDADDLLTAGMNCIRGVAAQTIAAVIFSQPQRADRLIPVIKSLANDPALAVRTLAAQAVLVLMRTHPGIALDIAVDLFNASVDIFGPGTTTNLLRAAILRQPDRFSTYLCRALDGPDLVAQRAGQVWAIAFVQDELKDPVPTTLAVLRPSARRGAAQVFANEPGAAPNLLQDLLEDEDPTVRTAAAVSMRHMEGLDAQTEQSIVRVFIESATFAEHYESLFDALGDTLNILHEEILLAACEKAVMAAGHALGDIRTRWAAVSDNIVTVVLRVYRQANADIRARCLNLIDALSDAGAFGLEEALSVER
jgi:hypothetical protein